MKNYSRKVTSDSRAAFNWATKRNPKEQKTPKGGGGEEQGWIIVGRENIKVSTKRSVRWQIGECEVTGGRGGLCMCTGMTNAMFYGNVDTDEDRYCTG